MSWEDDAAGVLRDAANAFPTTARDNVKQWLLERADEIQMSKWDDLPRCIMCGAERGKPCTYNSTVHEEGWDQVEGEVRYAPHAARGRVGDPDPQGWAIKDEPAYYLGS